MASYGIIFDLDGTLAYTLDDIATAVNNTLSKLGYKTRSKAEILKFINNGARELIRRALPKTVQDIEFIVDSALDVYGEEYSKCYLEKTQAYEGICEVLAEEKKEGVKLAVLSNKQDAFVKDIVNSLFGKKMFSFVQGQAGMPTKPDPSAAFLACKQMGVKPSNCIFVGDSDVDIKTAQNAQMTSVGVSWGYREKEVLLEAQADFIVDTPADLYNVLNEQFLKRKQAAKSK